MEDAIQRLQCKFPSTLAERDTINSSMVSIESPADHYDIINLAHETNLLSILPGALFECINQGLIDHLLTGAPRGDGTIVAISPEDQQKCLSASRTYRWLYPLPGSMTGCTNTRPCRRRRQWGGSFEASCDSIFTTWKPSWESYLCTDWNKLPSMFGLPDWDILRQTMLFCMRFPSPDVPTDLIDGYLFSETLPLLDFAGTHRST